MNEDNNHEMRNLVQEEKRNVEGKAGMTNSCMTKTYISPETCLFELLRC